MKQRTIVLGLIMLMSCNFGGQWNDENIDSKVKAEIMVLNTQILDALANRDPEKMKNIASDKLLERSKALDSIVKFGNWAINPAKFRIKNQFHLKKSADGTDSKVFSGLTGDHDYTIFFKAINKETFVSVGFLESDLQALSLTMIYGKYNDNWKLNILQVGTLEIEDKDAIDWYHSAQENLVKGNLVDAALNYALSSQCLKPANQLWQYRLEKEITDFGQKMNADIGKAYIFPLSIEPVKSKPKIFRVYPQGMKEGYYPTVLYITTLNIMDTTALSKECNEIHKDIGQVFKGLDQGKKYIFYRAFEKLPGGIEQVKSYGFIRRGEK